MPTVDTFLTDLRRYIQHEDTKPLLGPSFYQALVAGQLSREQLKKWALNLYYVTGQHIRAFEGIARDMAAESFTGGVSLAVEDRG